MGLMVLPIFSIVIAGITLLLRHSRLVLDGNRLGPGQGEPASVAASLTGDGSN